MKESKINLIYPGSFDPFHKGHADAIRRLYDYYEGDMNLIVLLQPNRFKDSAMFDMNFKFDFLKRCIKDRFSNYNIDVRRTEEKSFSTYWFITSLEDYKLVVGDDVLSSINKWRDFSLMIEHGLEIVVVQRDLSYEQIESYKTVYPISDIIYHDRESVNISCKISSTSIRNEIMNIMSNHI